MEANIKYGSVKLIQAIVNIDDDKLRVGEAMAEMTLQNWMANVNRM